MNYWDYLGYSNLPVPVPAPTPEGPNPYEERRKAEKEMRRLRKEAKRELERIARELELQDIIKVAEFFAKYPNVKYCQAPDAPKIPSIGTGKPKLNYKSWIVEKPENFLRSAAEIALFYNSLNLGYNPVGPSTPKVEVPSSVAETEAMSELKNPHTPQGGGYKQTQRVQSPGQARRGVALEAVVTSGADMFNALEINENYFPEIKFGYLLINKNMCCYEVFGSPDGGDKRYMHEGAGKSVLRMYFNYAKLPIPNGLN